MSSTDSRPIDTHADDTTILILSADAVAAALFGALLETLGYAVRFARPPEESEDAIRRVRPRVCLVDCDDETTCTSELLGRAAMRGISVVIFGRSAALDRALALAREHDIELLLVPPDASTLDAAVRRALRRAG
jgi:DNA-binding NtrC family response regulator